MEQQLLDLESLRLQSVFSQTPVAEQLNIQGQLIPLVAINRWIMPKSCFVTIWTWFMLDGQAYHKLVNHSAWDPILQILNPEQTTQVGTKAANGQIMSTIFHSMYHDYRHLNLTVMDKRDMFVRVISSLTSDVELMAA